MLSFEILPMALYRQPYSYPLASGFYVVYLRFYHCSKAKLRVVCTDTLPEQKNNTNDDLISIEGVLKPALVRFYENDTSPNASLQSAKCINIFGWPSYGISFSALPSVIGMIGNVSSSTSILILEGQNDSQTPLQQALLLQQRLTEVNHPDHQIIVYPDLGHTFVPTNQWISTPGQMPEYVFQDLYEWLTSPTRDVNG